MGKGEHPTSNIERPTSSVRGFGLTLALSPEERGKRLPRLEKDKRLDWSN